MATSNPAPNATSSQSAGASAEPPAPIIVDLGKKDRKQVRKLRKGKPGRLMNRVEEAIEHLRENGAISEGVQPIVVIVKQRERRRGGRLAKAWGLG